MWSCVVVFTAAVSLKFPPVNGADDRFERRGMANAEINGLDGGSSTDRRASCRKRKGFTAGQVRKDELLAKAITTDGRKEWCCRYCSETNVANTGKRCQQRTRVVEAGLSRRPRAVQPSGQKRAAVHAEPTMPTNTGCSALCTCLIPDMNDRSL